MLDRQRIKLCARIFNAPGVQLTILADKRIIYQVGQSWQCSTIEELEYKAEQMLRYRKHLKP